MTRHVIHGSSNAGGENARRGALLAAFAYVWAMPTTLLGLLFLPGTLLSGGGARVVGGVIEIHGGLTRFLLRHCMLLKGGASALTLGHVVLALDPATHDLTRSHERVHVRQCERWGPLFLPAYLCASAIALARGKHYYFDNAFEREAYDRDH